MRTQPLLVALVLIVVSVFSASRTMVAQVRTPTTPWGDPDLQGVWSNQTPVTFERIPPLARKPVFTKEEAAEFERTTLERLLDPQGPLGPELPLSGETNEVWQEAQHGKVPPNRNTSLVVDPPDGRIPYTPEGRKRWDAVPSLERMLLGKPLTANSPEDRTVDERCITTGGLIDPNPFYNNNHLIVQSPGYVVILTEMMHEHRVIPLDGRPRLGVNIRQWLGDSRGRWEGQTLVVETTNFNDQRLFRGATRNMRLLERFTRLSADTILYRATVTDPATFARPWTVENGLRKSIGLYEVGCHEGNYGLANILRAARAEEKR
jgi:hypothetical protein